MGPKLKATATTAATPSPNASPADDGAAATAIVPAPAAATIPAPAAAPTDADAAPAPVRARRPRGQSAKAKKRTEFQHRWLSKYALRVTALDAETSSVLTLACRLCEKYGREKVLLAEDGTPKPKRRRTTNVKQFKAPWRSDNIAHHARDQHARRFAEYDALPDKEKEAFLAFTGEPVHDDIGDVEYAVATLQMKQAPLNDTPAEFLAATAATMTSAPAAATVTPPPVAAAVLASAAAPAEPAPPGERFVSLVDAPIVDAIVCELLLDTDSQYGALVQDPAQARAIFSRQSDAAWLVAVPHKPDFELCLQYIASGTSFRQCVNMVKEAQEQTPRGKIIGPVSPATVISFVRFATAMNFQVLAAMLKQAWAFSVVLDGSSRQKSSYVDVRVRVALDERIRDFHVLTLPTHDRHAHHFDAVCKLLTALHGGWERKLVGVVSSGDAQLADVVARLQQSAAESCCYRTWSGAQQIERVVDAVFRKLFDDALVDEMVAITGYLRGQDELVAAMQSECPRFVDTSWVAMGRLIDWFMAKRGDVKTHFDTAQPACAPQPRWWVLMAALKRFADIVNSTLRKISGLTTQLNQQRESIDAMLAELIEVGYVRGSNESLFEAREMDSEENGQQFVFGQFYTTHRGAELLLEDLDPFVFELLESLKESDVGDSYDALVASIAQMYGESVSELSKIAGSGGGERSQAVGASPAKASPAKAHEASSATKLPSVLPHELVRLSGAELNRLLRAHQPRLVAAFGSDEASAIHSEHAQLKTAFIRDASFKTQIELMSSTWSFEKAWGSVGEACPRLRSFAAGLATAYPDAVSASARGSADPFAVLGYERSEYRSSLADFSLEAILHCRQYPALQQIASRTSL